MHNIFTKVCTSSSTNILHVKYVLRQCICTHTYIDAYFAQSPRDSVPYIPRDSYQDFHPYASCKSSFPPFQVSWNAGFRAPKRYRTRRGAHPRRDIMIIHLYSYAIGFSYIGRGTKRTASLFLPLSPSIRDVIRSTL